MNTKITILLPVYNRLELTKETLAELSRKIKEANPDRYTIIVIDDGSTDGTSEWIKDKYPDVILLEGNGNLWWSGAINMGAKYAIDVLHTDYILLYNNDIHVDDSYFYSVLQVLKKNDNNTIIGSKIYVAENPELVWSMGGFFNAKSGKYGMYGYFETDSQKFNVISHVDWLTGMGTLIPKEIIDRIGYWDNKRFPQYHGDSDFTYRAKLNGFKVIVDPTLKMYNFVQNSGIEHKGSFKILMQLLTHTRSKSNIKKIFCFYKLYTTSIFAYFTLIWLYFKIFGGFFKWKFLALFRLKKR